MIQLKYFIETEMLLNCKAKEMGIKKIDRYASNGIANKKYNIK